MPGAAAEVALKVRNYERWSSVAKTRIPTILIFGLNTTVNQISLWEDSNTWIGIHLSWMMSCYVLSLRQYRVNHSEWQTKSFFVFATDTRNAHASILFSLFYVYHPQTVGSWTFFLLARAQNLGLTNHEIFAGCLRCCPLTINCLLHSRTQTWISHHQQNLNLFLNTFTSNLK